MHFIGHLQANKINQLIDHISCLETLDSRRVWPGSWIAGWTPGTGNLDVLIQVNVSGEESKSGVAPEAAARPAGRRRSMPTADASAGT